MSDYKLNDDGTATFEFETFTRHLKRPTLGQYRIIVELLGQITQGSVKIRIEKVLDWWDTVFTTLAGEGLPKRPVTHDEDAAPSEEYDDDKLPPWIVTDETMVELIGHWQANPSRRGDR